MRQYLSAQIQAASQIELEEVVDSAALRNLKARDEHPEIRLYSIGHEGEANLRLPGIGNTTFRWIQAAVQLIADRLKIGTPVFDSHTSDTNSHVGRTQIGEVVGKVVKKIGERLNTLAAIYIYPQFKSRPLDIASFETEILFDHDGQQAWPRDIKDVSGIALGNSNTATPGFPGATLLSAVQAYVQASAGEIGDNKMNLSDVKKAVTDLGLTPAQVFDVGAIMEDSTVITRVKKDHENVYNASERIRQERDKARERVIELENTNAETNKKLQQHTMQSKSVTVFDAVLADPERKLDDRAKTFIKRTLKDFSTTAEDDDALKIDVGKFVDTQVVEYNEQAKLFGAETITPGDSKVFKLPSELTVDQKVLPNISTEQINIPPTRDVILREEMDPDKNPLIVGGKAAKDAQQT